MSDPDWQGAARFDDFRNRIEVEYIDGTTGERRVAVAAHQESYDALGQVWRTMVVHDTEGSGIDTPEKAQALADACLADLCFH